MALFSAAKMIDAGPATEYRIKPEPYGFDIVNIPQKRTYLTQTWRMLTNAAADFATWFVGTPAGYDQGSIRHTIGYETPLPIYQHDENFVQPPNEDDWHPTRAEYFATTTTTTTAGA